MEVEWRRLRADQLREAATKDAMVILPVASIEQHGPHLPVETDTMIGEAVAVRTARAISARGETALVLPVLWTGLSEHHMPFGGTITLSLAAFSAVIEDVCRSVVRHGFRRIALSNSHGGNVNALRTLTDDLTVKLKVPIVFFTYAEAVQPVIAKLLTTQGGVRHACEAETAIMLALRPDLVATDRIPPRPNAPPETDAGLSRWRSFAVRTETGVMGNPDAASAEQGERLLDAIAEALAVKLTNPELWRASFLPEARG
ncbi:MAG: creatininase family protein [Acetobacteraceae bacterium]